MVANTSKLQVLMHVYKFQNFRKIVISTGQGRRERFNKAKRFTDIEKS